MNAGILFYSARKTSVCQKIIGRAAGFFGMEISSVSVCTSQGGVSGGIAPLLHELSAVFLVSSSPEKRPDCAPDVFRILRVPLDREGEPRGVLKLKGGEKQGYLVESLNQAIAILPDDPVEILRMLPAAFGRLREKFELDGEFPAARKIDYAELVERCMGPAEDEPDSGE
jgi:hypothetical protein